jgi:hypothetical protein
MPTSADIGQAGRLPHMPAELIADVQVWRAATRVDAAELQPTGPRQLGPATRIFQEQTETGHGGNCSPPKSPALLRTHSCRSRRLVRGSAWHFVRYRDYDISVNDGSARRSRQLPGDARYMGKPDVPPMGTPKGYEGGDASFSSRLTTRTCPRSLWRSNDIRRTSRIATGNPTGGTP